MTNAVGKGKRIEKLCADELLDKGYLIWKSFRAKYQNQDLFGLFDVAAIHPEGECLLLIQVKANRVDNKTRDAISALKVPAGCQKWIWIWKDRKYWIKEFYE